MTQEIIDAVKEAKEQAKPRNFTQSIDVIINLKDLDVRKPEFLMAVAKRSKSESLLMGN